MTWFWCTRRREMIAELVCLRRMARGLKRCAGCEQGEELADRHLAERRKEGQHKGEVNP